MQNALDSLRGWCKNVDYAPDNRSDGFLGPPQCVTFRLLYTTYIQSGLGKHNLVSTIQEKIFVKIVSLIYM
jgi:hypothetical protein